MLLAPSAHAAGGNAVLTGNHISTNMSTDDTAWDTYGQATVSLSSDTADFAATKCVGAVTGNVPAIRLDFTNNSNPDGSGSYWFRADGTSGLLNSGSAYEEPDAVAYDYVTSGASGGAWSIDLTNTAGTGLLNAGYYTVNAYCVPDGSNASASLPDTSIARSLGTFLVVLVGFDRAGTATTAAAGSSFPVSAYGISGGDTVTVILSDGITDTTLATAGSPLNFDNNNGNVTGTLVIPATIAPGSYTLTLVGLPSERVTESLDFTVTAPATVPVTNVAINETCGTLGIGATAQLTTTVTPSTATDRAVVWSTDTTGHVTVSSTGLVTAVTVGPATVKATAHDGSGKFASCNFTVAPTVSVTPANRWLLQGQTVQLTGKVNPAPTTTPTFTWASSATTVAAIATTGKVTAQPKSGTSTITATVKGNATMKGTTTVTVKTIKDVQTQLNYLGCKDSNKAKLAVDGTFGTKTKQAMNKFQTMNGITVSSTANSATLSGMYSASAIPCTKIYPVTGVKVTPATRWLMQGQTVQLTGTVAPTNATDKSLTWSSSATTVATVATTGKVTAKAKSGVATVTAKAKTISTIKASSTITVKTIKDVQTRLKALGCKDSTNKVLAVDGTFGTKSKQAMNKFQKVAGLTVSSAPNSSTLSNLYADDAPVCSTVTKVTDVTVSPVTRWLMQGQTVQLTATVAPSNATDKTVSWTSSVSTVASVASTGKVTALAKSGVTTITVKSNMVSTAKSTSVVTVKTIKDVQTRLNALGCKDSSKAKLSVDGTFGTKSKQAMNNFQTVAGITLSSAPNSTTLKAMFASDAPICSLA